MRKVAKGPVDATSPLGQLVVALVILSGCGVQHLLVATRPAGSNTGGAGSTTTGGLAATAGSTGGAVPMVPPCRDASCGNGQLCIDGGCDVDPCFGVNCSGAGTACYAGVCRCGGPAGPACSEDETCQANACVPGTICNGVTCTPGNVCGADQLCHCAQVDGPVCAGGSTCTLFFSGDGLGIANVLPIADGGLMGLCLGGNPCDGVTCPSSFETCNTDTGVCDCGQGSQAGEPTQCPESQFCSSIDGDPVAAKCFQPCDPYGQDCFILTQLDDGAPDASLGCYYESKIGTPVCEQVGSHPGGALAPCHDNTDCQASLGCFALGSGADAGPIRECCGYCDVFDGGEHLCAENLQCVPVIIVVNDAGTKLAIGACEPYAAARPH